MENLNDQALIQAISIIINKYGPTQDYCEKQCPAKEGCEFERKRAKCISRQADWYKSIRNDLTFS